MPELPRGVLWWVRWTVRKEWREALLGDLEEILHADLEKGLSPARARRSALREALRSSFAGFRISALPWTGTSGSRSQTRGDTPMSAFFSDLRLAARGLRRVPMFTFVVVATLALGIGCVTAFWSLIDAVLLRPLPFPEPARIIQVWSESFQAPGGSWNMSYLDYQDLKSEVHGFSDLSVYQSTFSNLLRKGEAPERVPMVFISHDFFDTLGLPLAAGRDFMAMDDRKGAEATVILGAEFWRSRLGSDPSVLGSVLRVDDVPRTVIGVAPEGLRFPRVADLYLPVNGLSGTEIRGVHSLMTVGRLAPEADPAQVQEEVSRLAAHLREEYPQSNATLGMRVDSLHESLTGEVRPRLLLLCAAAGLLLLVVCANVSSLLLERVTRRRREVAMRAALGASNGQLLRHFLAESLVLVGLGIVGALGVANVVRRILLAFGPSLPRHVEPALDVRTLGFAILVTAIIGGLFALIPGLHALGRDLYRRLGVGMVGSEDRGGKRWRSAFVVAQIALAVVLSLGAALLVQSLNRLYDVDLGFDPEGILAVDMEVPTQYVSDQWPATVAFYERLIAELEARPGVRSAAAAHHHPANPGWTTSFHVKGQPEAAEGFEPEANFRPVTGGYFETVGIPLLRGRVFDSTARSEPPGQVVVNQAFVDQFLGGGEGVGEVIERTSWWIREITEYEIVGVVANTRFAGRHQAPRPAMYLPHRQDIPPSMTVLIRAEPGIRPKSLASVMREAVWAIDPEMPIGSMMTLEELVAHTVSIRRFLTWLLTAFAAVTLGLAALGLYGALAFTTARRTRELGLRMALGAGASHLRGMVLGEGLRLVALGVVLGLLGAWFASAVLESILYGIDRGDPTTFLGIAALLGAVAIAAGWLPAWRATRIDPCRALAEE